MQSVQSKRKFLNIPISDIFISFSIQTFHRKFLRICFGKMGQLRMKIACIHRAWVVNDREIANVPEMA